MQNIGCEGGGCDGVGGLMSGEDRGGVRECRRQRDDNIIIQKRGRRNLNSFTFISSLLHHFFILLSSLYPISYVSHHLIPSYLITSLNLK